MVANHKREGFKGEKSLVIPRMVLEKMRDNDISEKLYITDIGYYPRAKHHFREREKGCEQFIFIYCAEGRGRYNLKDTNYKVDTGEFFILPKNIKHKYAANEDKPWSIYWVHFKGKLAKSFFNKFYAKNKNKPVFIEYLDERIGMFYEIFDNLEMGYSKNNILYANICFYRFLASFLFPNQFYQVRKEKVADTIDDSIYYMKENLNRDIALGELAEYANLSKSHYSRLFKEKTGWSPIAYFNHLKIKKACQILDTSDKRINQISYQLGFNDPYYFSRLFKKIMGVSPRYYRRKQRG